MGYWVFGFINYEIIYYAMLDLKVCVVCLRTDIKLYNLDVNKLRSDFNEISGLNHKLGNGLPNYLCVECYAQVKSFKKFRTKCHKANFTLLQILNHNNEIVIDDIEAIDKRAIGLLPMLSNWSLDRVHYESVKFQWVKHNRFGLVKGGVPVLSVDNLTSEKDQSVSLNNDLTSEVSVNEVKLEFELPSYSLNCTNTDNIHNEQDASEEQALEIFKNTEVPANDNYLNDDVDMCNDHNDETYSDDGNNVAEENEPHGSSLDEEYASIVPLSVKEQAAAAELYKLFSHGKYKCEVCSKGYHTEKRLKVHLRMHDKHVSGYFLCELCNYYYKTDFLLQTHITEKHLYKYICRKCPEVNFDRIAAKQHFIWTHLQNGNNKHANWYESRPSWLSTRGGKRTKGIVTIRPVRKIKKLPEDFLIFSPVSQEEQYEIVKARQKSKNYLESEFKCELCFRGFREPSTYNKHLRKHDPEVSGKCICDMCKWCFRDARKMYKHMHISHLFKYTCQMCNYVCYNKAQAHGHYRWHKNFIYVCPHCNKEFTKASTRLTHIRIKHPSTCICSICGHSFVSDIGLYFHKQRAHTKEEIAMSENPKDTETVDSKLYCEDCKILFLSSEAFTTHLGSSNKHTNVNLSVQPSGKGKLHKDNKEGQRGRARGARGHSEVLNTGVATATTCEECGERLPNDVQARKHYRTQHPGTEYLKRYMCDVCGHTTKQYTNLLVHMRTHTNEKPYACPHCDRRFSMPSNRDRHLVVHTGEKRYECEHCHRRFTQSSAVKLHIQTVHLKIPYAPWDKKNRKRRKEVEVVIPQHEPPKILMDTQSEYLNAYISYRDE